MYAAQHGFSPLTGRVFVVVAATGSGDSTTIREAVDLNNDGVVDIFDAVAIGSNWQSQAG